MATVSSAGLIEDLAGDRVVELIYQSGDVLEAVYIDVLDVIQLSARLGQYSTAVSHIS
jgi:hypothetical protein